MKKHYFFFDIDGTLTVRETGEIVPSAEKALEKLRAAGHFVAIATGRAHYKARWFFDAHGFDNMVCNGGHGIVMDGKLVENRPINQKLARSLYLEAKAKGFGVMCATDDSVKVYAEDFRFYDQAGYRLEPTTYIIDEHFDPMAETIYKMYVSVPPEREGELETLSEIARQNDIGALRFEKNYLIIQPDNKKAGVMRLLSLAGGNPEDTVVFGDDTNDLVMFDELFYKIAMGNGCDALKARADEVAPANVDDGIYRVCEAHGFFEPIDE